ncbi:MAG: hypothetical protein GX806_06885 [Lentisphaerae bacterium]|nr:hypothetical protein [Lentisphaerota bacterium]
MPLMTMRQGRWLGPAGMLLASLLLLGCNGGDGGGQWSEQDFGPNNQNICLALGDSITAGSCLPNYSLGYIPKLAEMLQKNIINVAIPGSDTSVGVDIVHPALDRTLPGFLLVLYGVNDLIVGYSEAGALYNLRTIVRAAQDNHTVPIIATLTPVSGSYIGLVSGIKRLNAGIRQLADEEGAYLVDLEKALAWDPAYLLADGLHPNAMGNVIMAAEFYDILH